MSARDILDEASFQARRESFNGANRLLDALADWWLAESASHFHVGDGLKFVYDMPGMASTPAVRAARAYLDGDDA